MEIGFIGLGVMGKPMSKNLIDAGHTVVVVERNNRATQELTAYGARIARSPKEVALASEVVITMLPNSPEVQEVILGKDGIIESNKKGLVVIDMSSISPIVSREIHERLQKAGMHILDAPVSGGEPKAIDGTLSVMVGGNHEIFERYYEVMKTMAASVVRVGESGAGNTTKLCNQIIVALNIIAVSEALVLARKAGVAPELVYDAIRGGLAGSTVLDAKAPLILKRKFAPGFRIDLHAKDLQNVLDTSHNLGIPLPFSSMAMEIMQSLKTMGAGGDDHGALVKYFEKIANITVGVEN